MSTLSNKAKIVYVRRKALSVPEAAANNSPELKAYYDNAYRAIGSYWPKNSQRPGTGLNITEENFLMPYVLNISKDDRDFREKSTNFFHDITTKIDPTVMDQKGFETGGTPLDISLYNNEEELSPENLPNNISDYIRYRHIISHPDVALSADDAKGNPLKKYYIHDDVKVTLGNVSNADAKDLAMEAYLQVKKDAAKVIQYLTLLKVDSRDYRGQETVKLRDLAVTKPLDFMKVHNNKNKDYYYMITDLLAAKVLEQVGTRILVKESGAQLGGTSEEAIAYLKDPANSKQVVIFKSLVQDYKKKENLHVEPADSSITTTTAE